MDYKEIFRLVKEEIEAQGVPKSSWVWQDYLNDYDNFLWELKRDKDIEKNNFESEEEVAECISDQLMHNYAWSVFEQNGCL